MKLRLLFILFIAFSFTAFAGGKRDTVIKTVKLKGGFRVAYRHFDSINYVAIEKGKMSNELGEGEADTSMPLDNLGYLYADFDKYFAMVIHLGPTPIKVSIYDKAGGLLYYGLTPFYLDTVKGYIMYEGAYGKKGKLILFSARTGNIELFNAPTDTPCFGYCCWKVTGITDKQVMIEYYNKEGKSITKTFERK